MKVKGFKKIMGPFRAACESLLPRPTPPHSPEDNGKTNLLIISRFVPEFDRGSGELRFFSIIRLLSRCYNITYLSRERHEGYRRGRGDKYVDALEELGVIVHVARFNLKSILKGNFRFALLEVYSTADKYIEEIRARSPGTFIITDSVDVFFYREMKMAEVYADDEMRRGALETKRKELAVYKKSDMVWTVTGLDRDILLSEKPGLNVAIVPNVHEMSAGPSDASERERGVLVFVGGFRHRPNEDAVLYFCGEVLPLVRKRLPGVRLRIVGDSPPPSITALRSDSIEVTGRVPDTMPYLRTSYISIAPLRYGAGLKGKIGEAMSIGLPVVTTSIGVQGMDARIGEDIMVGDTPEAFSDCILRLSEDEALYRAVTENSFNYMRNNYSPEIVGGILSEIFLKIEERAVRQG
ncbi:MAG: glycosyltransferase family 4 protein [Candidatus Methylomirabilis sp.]|nr:glycosyltransferase family 4 protein [Deltaproteobacteria bacterium]